MATEKKVVNYTTAEGKIDTELLRAEFDALLLDAEKINAGTFGSLVAGRRFRLKTFELTNGFKSARSVTPKKK
jgi:hypothetical protein